MSAVHVNHPLLINQTSFFISSIVDLVIRNNFSLSAPSSLVHSAFKYLIEYYCHDNTYFGMESNDSTLYTKKNLKLNTAFNGSLIAFDILISCSSVMMQCFS